MSTTINIAVGDGGLPERNRQQTTANRQAYVQGKASEQAAEGGVLALRAQRIAEGRDPLTGGQLIPGSSSRLQRLDQQPAANRRRVADEFPFAIGWVRYYNDPGLGSNVLALVSGDGSVSIEFPFSNTNIPAVLTQYEGSFTRHDTSPSWSFQANNNPFLFALTPFPTSYWLREGRLSALEFSLILQSDFAIDNKRLSLPLSEQAFIYASIRKAKKFVDDYLLSCELAGDPPSFGFSVREEVVGSSGDDPDVLFADPDTVKRIRFYIDRTITVIDSTTGTVDDNINKAHIIGKSSLREISVPSSLSARVTQLWGDPPSNPDSLQYGFYPFFPAFINSTIFNSVQYLEASVEVSITQEPTGMTYRDFNAPPDGITDPDQAGAWDWTPIATFGLVAVTPFNAEFYRGSEFGGTPFAYRILDGSNTLVEADFYSDGSAYFIPDTLQALSPLPSKFMWIDTAIEDENGDYLNPFVPSANVKFTTYKSDPTNARADGSWDDFKLEPNEEYPNGLPSIPGTPATLSVRLAADIYQSSEAFPILTTPYGDKAYCRTKLLEFGFTAADLTP